MGVVGPPIRRRPRFSDPLFRRWGLGLTRSFDTSLCPPSFRRTSPLPTFERDLKGPQIKSFGFMNHERTSSTPGGPVYLTPKSCFMKRYFLSIRRSVQVSLCPVKRGTFYVLELVICRKKVSSPRGPVRTEPPS